MITDFPTIVIFGHGRSGTSTFRKIINCHESAFIIGEPFNKDFQKWASPNTPHFLDMVAKQGIGYTFKVLKKHCRGIKHLKQQLNYPQNKWIITNPNHRIILMWRRNLLQTAVSIELAKFSGIWAIQDTKNLKSAYVNMPPIDLDMLRHHIKRVGREMNKYKALIKSRPHIEVVYEDFYLQMNLEKQLELLNKTFEFIGLNPDEFNWAKIRSFLDKSSNKMNNDYKMIPNYNEIVKLGNKVTGFLTV